MLCCVFLFLFYDLYSFCMRLGVLLLLCFVRFCVFQQPGRIRAALGGSGQLGQSRRGLGHTFSYLLRLRSSQHSSLLSVPLRPFASLCIAFRFFKCYFVSLAFFVLFIVLGESRAFLFSDFAPIFSALDRISFVDLDQRSIGLRTFDRSSNVRFVLTFIYYLQSTFERSIGLGTLLQIQFAST